MHLMHVYKDYTETADKRAINTWGMLRLARVKPARKSSLNLKAS